MCKFPAPLPQGCPCQPPPQKTTSGQGHKIPRQLLVTGQSRRVEVRATEALRKVRTPGAHGSHHTEVSSTEPRMESDRCCFLSPEFWGFREEKRRPGGSGRERGIPGPQGERVEFWGLREGERNSGGSERKRGIPEDQEGRVEDPISRGL